VPTGSAYSVFVFHFAPAAEDAAALERQGAKALKLSQVEADAIIPPPRYFMAKPPPTMKRRETDGKATEMNSFLYWCKKKMTSSKWKRF